MSGARTILITGAAGNLGGLLARRLVSGGHALELMYHRKPIAPDLAAAANVRALQDDLADPRTLPAAVEGVDVAVHFAGVLFAPRRYEPRAPRVDPDPPVSNLRIGMLDFMNFRLSRPRPFDLAQGRPERRRGARERSGAQARQRW